jgi:hypothetical protein
MKLGDRQIGPFPIEEHIGKYSYRLKVLATLRLHMVFHVNNFRPCSTSSLWHVVPVNVPQGDDDEFVVSHIFAICVNSLPEQRGTYLLFMTHFSDDDIPLVRHQQDEVYRVTALQHF